MKLSFQPFRSLFKEPFGTAHGLRTGTDSVFVRLEKDGINGYGEATTPPYVKEDQHSILAFLRKLGSDLDRDTIFNIDPREHPAARAALSTAYYDLISKLENVRISDLLELDGHSRTEERYAVITLGLKPIAEVASKLHELPLFNSLKVKLNGDNDSEVMRQVLQNDPRPVLLDANQGWRSVDQALEMLDLVPAGRLIGLEQPFPVDRLDLYNGLKRQRDALIIADESVQTIDDIAVAGNIFGGINIKLMKCGGLDQAVLILKQAQRSGLKVMLGSMSESSLGCGAMLHLKDHAHVVDLDGPWLIANDPFEGVELIGQEPGLVDGSDPGIGVRFKSRSNPFGA